MSQDLPVIKPSDAKAWIDCKRRVWLDNKATLTIIPSDDHFEQLIINLGLEHEKTVLDALSAKATVETASNETDTQRLMAEKAPVIYQAHLVDESRQIIGKPDFLILHDSGHYQAADAKLSLSEEKKEIQIQIGVYRELLANALPAIVFLGNGQHALIGDESQSIASKFLTQMRLLLDETSEPAVRYSHSTCRICPYKSHCKPTFEANDELSLLYGVQGRAADALEKAGIHTITQLANTKPDDIPDVPYLKGDAIKQRAALQAKSWITGKPYQVSSIALPQGQWIHFDIEDNPLTDTGEKHVYLWGFLIPLDSSDRGQEVFEYDWTDHSDDDEIGWLRFLDRIEHYRTRFPNLILAHYSSHEKTTISLYANRYAMEDNKTVRYLLDKDSPLFDLRKPVIENLVLPLQGYGLKDICKHPDLVNFQWQDDDSGSQWSVVQFNRFLSETDADQRTQLKADILSYNRDDVTATFRLEQWLRATFME